MPIPEKLQHTIPYLQKKIKLKNGKTTTLLLEVEQLHQSTDRHDWAMRTAISHIYEASKQGWDKQTAKALLAHLEHVHEHLQGERYIRDENDPTDTMLEIAPRLNIPEAVAFLEKILTGKDNEAQFTARLNLSLMFDKQPEAARTAARALTHRAVTTDVKRLIHGDLENWEPNEKKILKAMEKYRAKAEGKE